MDNYSDVAPRCAFYSLKVGGREATVLTTGTVSFACIEVPTSVQIEVQARVDVREATIRPQSTGIKAQITCATIIFHLPAAKNVWVDVASDEPLPPLYLFWHKPDTRKPDRHSKQVIYFEGSRIHEAGLITLRDGQTLYLDAGAIVRGAVYAAGARDICIKGRGILDNSYFLPPRRSRQSILLDGCSNVQLQDLTMIHPTGWMLVLCACDEVDVRNLHQIGHVLCSDGIDIVGSKNVRVRGCFLRNNDDCIVIKATNVSSGDLPTGFKDGCADVDNVVVEKCSLWNDQGGNAMEIGFELRTPHIRGITFRDIDVLGAHGSGAVFSIHNGDRAHVSNILWEDIRVEHFWDKLVDFRILRSRYSQDSERGSVSRVTLRNVQAVADIYNTPSLIGGYDKDHLISDVNFENFRLGEMMVQDPDMLHLFTKHARNIRFSGPS